MAEIYTRIRVKKGKDICRVTIHRPGDRNSIDSALMGELEHLVSQIETTTSRAIIFTGAGETYFIGGADGVEMMQCDPPGALDFSAGIQTLFNRMEKSPLILMAAINGLCFGGGFEFAMACDLRIAAKTARIGLPEVKVGLIPGGGGTQRLSRLVGTGLAMEMILTGRLYSAREAYQHGLIHRVATGDLDSEADKMLEPVFRNPQHALAYAKLAVKASQNRSFQEGLEIERKNFSRCFQNDYFVNLMYDQLKNGDLKTTVERPARIRNERRRDI